MQSQRDTMSPMITRISTKMKVAIASVAALVVVLVGATAGYAISYAERALPGVAVAGESVTGMSRDEVVSLIERRAADTKVTFDINGTATEASLADAGVTVDAEKTADAVFAANAGFASKIGALFTSQDVTPVLKTDEKALASFATELAATTGTPVIEAEVLLGEDGVTFTATQSASGSLVDEEAVKEAVMAQGAALASGSHSLEVREVSPKVTSEAASAAADAANAMVALGVALTDGVDAFEASAADKASWVKTDPQDDGTVKVSVDAAKSQAWVKSTVEDTNIEVVNGIHNVNTQGAVLAVAKEGVAGRTANNADALADALVAALDSGQAYSGEITYDEVAPTFEERLVAEGAENLVYQAAPGEKWVDINLSATTITLYEGATVVGGPFAMVPGAPKTPTVTGTYHVYLKYESQTMRGTNVDGTPYVAPNVPWVTYFTGSYAMHGAPWLSSFGWSGPEGSHGCLNMPVSAAKVVFDWADIGTTVVSHN